MCGAVVNLAVEHMDVDVSKATEPSSLNAEALRQYHDVSAAESRLLRSVAAAAKAGQDRVSLDNLAFLVAPHTHQGKSGGGYEFQTLAQAFDAMIDAVGAIILSSLNGEVYRAAIAETRRFNEELRNVRATKSGALPRTTSAASGLAAEGFEKDVLLDFETVNDRALSRIRLEHLNLISKFSLDQRKVVFQALHDGVTRGLNPLDVARQIKGSVTLTPFQMAAVDRYRYALQNAHRDVSAATNALNRGLRDGRFDRSVLNARRLGVPMTNDAINRAVDRYRTRYVSYRAKTIARTEALRAVHEGEAAVWDTAVEQGHVEKQQVEQTWITARDERVRDSHSVMQGQKRMMGKPFTSGNFASLRFPGDRKAPPEEVINCRCVLIRRLKPAKRRRVQERQPVDVRPPPQASVPGDGQVVTPPVAADLGAPAGAPLSFDLRRVGTGFAIDAETVIVNVETKALDAAWRRGSSDFYLPRGTVGKVPQIQAAAESGFSVPVPDVALGEGGVVNFTDGRHRFVYVRDISGQKYIPVAVPATQRAEFLRRFAPSSIESGASRLTANDVILHSSGEYYIPKPGALATMPESMSARPSRARRVPSAEAKAPGLQGGETPLTADEITAIVRPKPQATSQAAENIGDVGSMGALSPRQAADRASRRASFESELSASQSLTVGDLSADYAARFGYLPYNEWDIPKSKYKAVVAALRRSLKDGVALTNQERLALLGVKKSCSPRVFIRFGGEQ